RSSRSSRSSAGLADVIIDEDDAEPGGPVRIVDEFRRAAEPVELGAWRWALPAATCALFVLAILDVFGVLVLAIARARARGRGRARPEATPSAARARSRGGRARAPRS